MRKVHILAIFILVFSITNFASAEEKFTIKAGFDLSGNHEVSNGTNSVSKDVDNDISVSAEYTVIDEVIGFGGGIILQNPRNIEGYTGDFYFTSIYGLIKVGSLLEEKSPYFIGQLGYNLFSGDDDYKGSVTLKGGIYYGIGVGILLADNLQVEALYSLVALI